MKNSKTNQVATHIGNDIVAFGMPQSEDASTRQIPRLTIMSADGCDEGAYFPAQSIQVYGEDAVRQLRDFCDSLLIKKP